MAIPAIVPAAFVVGDAFCGATAVRTAGRVGAFTAGIAPYPVPPWAGAPG